MISREFKKRLIKEKIKISDIKEFTTINDKIKRKIITKIVLNNGIQYELIDDFIWYAARKNKKW